MTFWSSDLAEPGTDELAAWLRNVEGSPFGGYREEQGAVDEALQYLRDGEGEAPAVAVEVQPEDGAGAAAAPEAGGEASAEGRGGAGVRRARADRGGHLLIPTGRDGCHGGRPCRGPAELGPVAHQVSGL